MTAVLVAVLALVFLLLVLTTLVQTLYLESLRLRARELPALTYFKEALEDRIGLKTEQGALNFSLWKHSLLAVLGVLVLTLLARQGAVGWREAGEGLLLAWALMIVSSYVIPQLLYRQTEGRWLEALLPLLALLVVVMKPLAGLLGFLHSLAQLTEKNEPGEAEEATPAENIEALIDAGAEEGLIEEGDRKLIQSVVEFGDKRVREVMTARPGMVGIRQDATLEELRQLAIREQFSRIPVFGASLDEITGFVHVRDMFERDEDDRLALRVKDIARPIRFVPETKSVHDLLREMQKDGTHMVIVVDEYGNTAGLATMEDLVEEIVGEIRDEHEPDADVKADGEGGWIVSGSYDLDHLEDLTGAKPPEDTESTTIGGLATEWFGRVPRAGEIVERDGIRLEVLAANELRVSQVRLSRVALPEELEGE